MLDMCGDEGVDFGVLNPTRLARRWSLPRHFGVSASCSRASCPKQTSTTTISCLRRYIAAERS
jgi:hypothetical protein